MDINSGKALQIHTKTIRQKGFLKKLYIDFYKAFKKIKYINGPIVEIGTGGGFIKEIIPKVVTSDVIKGPNIDKVFSASSIPMKNNSVSAFFMFDVFHHIKDPEKALKEMDRCLKSKGKIIMIEPYPSKILGWFIYKYIHPEKNGFDTTSWKIKGKGRMSDANPILPWLVFIKERKIFQRKFPRLRIVKIVPHTPFRYLLAGGLSPYQFLPTKFYEATRTLENNLSLFNKYIAMFMTIELEKI